MVEAPASASPLVPGYLTGDRIGRGSQGDVYHMVHTKSSRHVAVKFLRTFDDSPRALADLRREIGALRSLRHPGIVEVFSDGEVDGRPYIVMEYLCDVSIDEFMLEQMHDQQVAVGLLAEVCEAIAHAHNEGVLHRDIKPSNILIDFDEVKPKVVDFGLACQQTDTVYTEAGSIVGTIAYFAPELAAGTVTRATMSTDIYALGVVLYQALSGQLPHRLPEDRLSALRMIASERPRPLRKAIRAGHAAGFVKERRVPVQLESIVHKALHQDPRKRYLSAGEMARDLRRYERGETIAATTLDVTFPIRYSLHALRRPIAAAVLLLGAVAGSYLVFDARRDAAQQRESFEVGMNAGILNKLAQAVRDQGQYDEAIRLLDESIAILGDSAVGRMELLRQLYEAQHARAETERVRGNLTLAREYADRAIDASNRMRNLDAESKRAAIASAYSHLLLGNISLEEGEHRRAREDFLLALSLLEVWRDDKAISREIAITHGRVGRCESRSGNARLAEDAYRKSLSEHERLLALDASPLQIVDVARAQLLLSLLLRKSDEAEPLREADDLAAEACNELQSLKSRDPFGFNAAMGPPLLDPLLRRNYCATGGPVGGLGRSDSSASPSSSGSVSPTLVSE